MRELSLFSGVGGGLLGTKLLGWNHVGYVEWDDYCQRIIAQRIDDGILDRAPIFGDIRAFVNEGYARAYQGMVDVITAGFPCQPFSVAGKRAGADDERNMWPATMDTIREIRPRYAFLENVPGLLNSGYFGTVVGDLAEGGYSVRWRILSAAEMGAPHKRDRLWVVAHTEGTGKQHNQFRETDFDRIGPIRSTGQVAHSNGRRRQQRDTSIGTVSKFDPQSDGVSHTNGKGLQEFTCGQFDSISESLETKHGSEFGRTLTTKKQRGWWEIEPDLDRVVDGIPNRVDRLRAIGNAQVPAVVATAWRLLTEDL